MARTASHKWKIFLRWRDSRINSFSGNWYSFAPARVRTTRCSPSSNSSATTISAISALISLARSAEIAQRRQSRSVAERRAGRCRPALRVMPYRHLCGHESGGARRRPAGGISGEGAARLQIKRSIRRRHGGDGGSRLPLERGRNHRVVALSRPPQAGFTLKKRALRARLSVTWA